MRFSKIVLAGAVLLNTAALPISAEPLLKKIAIGEPIKISDADSGNASSQDIVYNPANNEYFVVWAEETNGEFEIFGQRLNASTGEKIGPNEFRISQMGVDGDPETDAFTPQIAYNSDRNEYLVVWNGDESNNDFEVFGQRVSAEGVEVGEDDFRISDMGPDGNTIFLAITPKVAFNSTTKEYLVVWEGLDDADPATATDREVYGQRLNADGQEVGQNDFLIGEIEAGGNLQSNQPDVVYNPNKNEFAIAYSAETIFPGQVDQDREIFAHLLDATGNKITTAPIRVSDMGPDGSGNAFEARQPNIVYNDDDREYLVTWDSDDNEGGLVLGESEIFGQRLNEEGIEIGDNDFRISNAGPDGDNDFDAADPFAIYNSKNKEYVVGWDADDNENGFVDDDFTNFAQRLSRLGEEIGVNDFLVSRLGPDGDPNFDSFESVIGFNPNDNRYLITFNGSDADGKFEVFGQFFRDAQCGNGVVESENAETCDDGNLTAGDGCDAACLIEDDGGNNGGGGGCSLIR